MKTRTLYGLCVIAVMLLAAGCAKTNRTGRQKGQSDSLLEAAHQARDYDRLTGLADSLGKAGDMSEAWTYYWQGYVCDKKNQKRTAEYYWQKSLSAVSDFKDASEVDVYAKSASRLANLYSVKGDVDAVLKMALPVAEQLETLQADTTSDYVNLLVFIGCCESRYENSEKAADACFNKAYQKHLENIHNNHTDDAYKDAIAGLINISFNAIVIHKYNDAMIWINRFGEILNQYAVQPNVSQAYLDKQQARLDIYRATALEGLGQKAEAVEAYNSFLTTQYSKTAEGLFDAGDYLMMAQRWKEAADGYQKLNELINVRHIEFSFDNIQNVLLKKYRANLGAGRRDSVFAISKLICDSLDAAINRSKQDDAAELATIYETQQKESQIAQQRAQMSRQRLIGTFVALALTLAFFIIYTLYRRKVTKRLSKAHEDLKTAYAQLEETTTAKERIESELRIARDIQRSMVPAEFPQSEDLDFYASMIPAKEVGGDLYDYLLQDERLYFCVGDVSGKGVPASLFMAQTIRLFRTFAKLQRKPADIAKRLNNELSENNGNGMFVTMFIGQLDLITGRLCFCNAGHNQPVLGDKETGDCHFLDMEPNAPLGLWPDIDYVGEEIETIKDRSFLVYTDGLNEAENSQQEQFGDERLLQVLRNGAFKSAYQVVETLKAEVERHRNGAEPNDDLTMFCLKVK